MKKPILFIAFILAAAFSFAQTASDTLVAEIVNVDGEITSIKWTKVLGPDSHSFSAPNSATTVVSNLVEGTYRFELEVKNSVGKSARGSVIRFVLPAFIAPVIKIKSLETKTLRIQDK